MLVLRIQLLKELRYVGAGAVREVPRFFLALSIVATYVANDEGAEGLEAAAFELHSVSVAKVDVFVSRSSNGHCPIEGASRAHVRLIR